MKKLQNKLKEKRRIKRQRHPKPTNSNFPKPQNQKKPSLNNLCVPSIPAGEDETSFDGHNCVLHLQFSKSNRNVAIIKELMDITYPMRRRQIIETGHLFDIKKKFPFLQEPKYVSWVIIYVTK